MARKYDVIWTRESKDRVDRIIEFLFNNWGEKEVDEFLNLLLHFEKTITLFPKSFRASLRFKGCRLGLVHRHTTALYKIKGKTVIVLTVFDNRSSIER